MVTPSLLVAAALTLGDLGVPQRHERAALGRLQLDLEPRVRALGGELRGPPRLYDAPARVELQRLALDVAVPRGERAADARLDRRVAAREGAVPRPVEPRAVDIERIAGNYRGD